MIITKSSIPDLGLLLTLEEHTIPYLLVSLVTLNMQSYTINDKASMHMLC